MALPAPDLDDVLHDIPEEYRDRFEDLLRQPTVPTATLRAELDEYIATVRQVGPLVAFIDVDEAERITDAAMALVGLLRPDDAPGVHQLVQAAVQYFVLEEEDEEVTGVLGFDDDIQVINAVCRALLRHDLVISLKRSEG